MGCIAGIASGSGWSFGKIDPVAGVGASSSGGTARPA